MADSKLLEFRAAHARMHARTHTRTHAHTTHSQHAEHELRFTPLYHAFLGALEDRLTAFIRAEGVAPDELADYLRLSYRSNDTYAADTGARAHYLRLSYRSNDTYTDDYDTYTADTGACRTGAVQARCTCRQVHVPDTDTRQVNKPFAAQTQVPYADTRARRPPPPNSSVLHVLHAHGTTQGYTPAEQLCPTAALRRTAAPPPPVAQVHVRRVVTAGTGGTRTHRLRLSHRCTCAALSDGRQLPGQGSAHAPRVATCAWATRARAPRPRSCAAPSLH
jgi:hypothetical protein